MKVTDVITLDQLTTLRDAGFVVVHREPTESMSKAGASALGYTDGSVAQAFHRMVAESIRLQNES